MAVLLDVPCLLLFGKYFTARDLIRTVSGKFWFLKTCYVVMTSAISCQSSVMIDCDERISQVVNSVRTRYHGTVFAKFLQRKICDMFSVVFLALPRFNNMKHFGCMNIGNKFIPEESGTCNFLRTVP